MYAGSITDATQIEAKKVHFRKYGILSNENHGFRLDSCTVESKRFTSGGETLGLVVKARTTSASSLGPTKSSSRSERGREDAVVSSDTWTTNGASRLLICRLERGQFQRVINSGLNRGLRLACWAIFFMDEVSIPQPLIATFI